MAKTKFYRQCVLERKGAAEAASIELVTWLPEEKKGVQVEAGSVLKIKRLHGKAYDPAPWTVVSVGSNRLPEIEVSERSHGWDHCRKHSDI